MHSSLLTSVSSNKAYTCIFILTCSRLFWSGWVCPWWVLSETNPHVADNIQTEEDSKGRRPEAGWHFAFSATYAGTSSADTLFSFLRRDIHPTHTASTCTRNGRFCRSVVLSCLSFFWSLWASRCELVSGLRPVLCVRERCSCSLHLSSRWS